MLPTLRLSNFPTLIPMPPWVYRLLGIDPGQDVLRLDRVFFVQPWPVLVTVTAGVGPPLLVGVFLPPAAPPPPPGGEEPHNPPPAAPPAGPPGPPPAPHPRPRPPG